MDELVQIVMEKSGLPESQATAAVNAVLEFMKERLPAPLASQLERALNGETDNLTKGLSSLFSRK